MIIKIDKLPLNNNSNYEDIKVFNHFSPDIKIYQSIVWSLYQNLVTTEPCYRTVLSSFCVHLVRPDRDGGGLWDKWSGPERGGVLGYEYRLCRGLKKAHRDNLYQFMADDYIATP